MTATDGAKTIALYGKSGVEIQAVIMDMAMPIMDGPMSIRAIRRINPTAKIIAVSDLNMNGKLANIASSVNAFSAKPYSS